MTETEHWNTGLLRYSDPQCSGLSFQVQVIFLQSISGTLPVKTLNVECFNVGWLKDRINSNCNRDSNKVGEKYFFSLFKYLRFFLSVQLIGFKIFYWLHKKVVYRGSTVFLKQWKVSREKEPDILKINITLTLKQ